MRTYVVELGHRYCCKPLATIECQSFSEAIAIASPFRDAADSNALFEVSINKKAINQGGEK